MGCGFWAGYQVAAWREADASLQFAFCDRVADSAEALAKRFGSEKWYADAAAMLTQESLDVVDIITSPDTHAALTERVAAQGLPVICQKPMAPNESDARQMVATCQQAGVPLYIHENFRWQVPIRHLKRLLDVNQIGTPFRARIYFNSAFPVFDNQPFLAQLEQMMLADVGVHLLDVCRFLFGEVRRLFCLTQRVNPTIKGEDVATLLLEMENGMSCTLEMSYASVVDYECFPQTLVEVEGDRGAIRLAPNYRFTVTTREGQHTEQLALPAYDWVHPQYAVVQSSMVAIHQHFLAGLHHGRAVETTGEDNLKTLRLTYAAYDSAEQGKVITID